MPATRTMGFPSLRTPRFSLSVKFLETVYLAVLFDLEYLVFSENKASYTADFS